MFDLNLTMSGECVFDKDLFLMHSYVVVVEVVRHYREEGDVSEVSNNQSFSASTEFFGKLNNFLITYYWVSRYLEVPEFFTKRTVWKLKHFSFTQILREINFG